MQGCSRSALQTDNERSRSGLIIFQFKDLKVLEPNRPAVEAAPKTAANRLNRKDQLPTQIISPEIVGRQIVGEHVDRRIKTLENVFLAQIVVAENQLPRTGKLGEALFQKVQLALQSNYLIWVHFIIILA